MKKSILILLFSIIITNWLVSEQIDNIVLLDTSVSMVPYYSGTVNYLINDIVKQQLQIGDTFHLLSFNDSPEYEISRTIKGESEIIDILNRILLLQPVGKYTDLITAFAYLYEYTDKLRLNSIKNIIILTDGIHDPPPDSSYPVSDTNLDDIKRISENMKRQGWKVSLIRFPSTSNDAENSKNEQSTTSNSVNVSSENKNDLFPTIAKTLDKEIISSENADNHEMTGSPEIIFPKDLGSVGNSFKVQFIFKNPLPEPILLKLANIDTEGISLTNKPYTINVKAQDEKAITFIIELPADWKKGVHNTAIELIFKDNYRAYPRNGYLNYKFDPAIKGSYNKINTRIILYIIIGIILLVILVFVLINLFRNMNFSKNETTNQNMIRNKELKTSNSSNHVKNFSDLRKNIKPGQIVIEMIVKYQNRQIGQRNIHVIGDNHPLSVGGAGSEYFLIFIIPTGKRIAEIVMEDGMVSFKPLNSENFPDLPDGEVKDCLNMPIRVVNKNGKETSIVFKEWISPVERLNRIMHLVDKRGLPNFRY